MDKAVLFSITDTIEMQGGRVYGSLFEQAAWLEVLLASYQLQLCYSEPKLGSRICWAKINKLGHEKYISLPYSDYIVPGISIIELEEHLALLKKAYPQACFELRFACLSPEPGSATLQDAILHRVDLSKKVFSSAFKRSLRKAQREGVSVQQSTDHADFQLFCEQLRIYRREKFGVISPPKKFFEQVYTRFLAQGKGTIFTAIKEGQAIAWALVLFCGKEAFYKWGCSLPEFAEFRPNNKLFYQLQLELSEQGFEVLDLGLSFKEGNEGLVRFKAAMGGATYPICRLKAYGDGYPAEAEIQFNKLVSEMGKIVAESKLSNNWRETFSDALYPYFS